MIFPVQLIININAQVFAAANLFNVIITQLESEVMFFCHLASEKHYMRFYQASFISIKPFAEWS